MMLRRARVALPLACALVLSACGGGGGGGADNGWLSFTPASVAVNAFEGETPTFSINATSSKTITGVFNVGVIDATGVIDPQATTVQANTQTSYTASFKLAAALAVGTHSGRFELRLCRDDPTVCAQPIDGSPWFVPYTVTIKSSTNLSPLQPLAGAGAWSTFQGSARHSGYVAADLDASKFSRRFRVSFAAGDIVSHAVADGGVAIVTTGTTFGNWTLRALNEATGQPQWTQPIGAGTLHHVNAPALGGGKVYATSTGHQDTYAWTFSAADGSLVNQVAMGSQWEHYLAPTVADGAVYSNFGSYGGLARFNAQTGALDWFNANLLQYDGWTPAVEGGMAYALIADKLQVFNVADGSVAFTIDDPQYTWSGWTVRGAPVLADGGVVYASQTTMDRAHVVRFDTASRTLVWSAGTLVKSQPVVAGDTLYVLDGRELHARSAATGALLWSWQTPSDFTSGNNIADYSNPVPLVVVGHHAFVSTIDGIKAVNLNTRQVDWQDPASGSLAVSPNGVLYISGNGVLTAVNLH